MNTEEAMNKVLCLLAGLLIWAGDANAMQFRPLNKPFEIQQPHKYGLVTCRFIVPGGKVGMTYHLSGLTGALHVEKDSFQGSYHLQAGYSPIPPQKLGAPQRTLFINRSFPLAEQVTLKVACTVRSSIPAAHNCKSLRGGGCDICIGKTCEHVSFTISATGGTPPPRAPAER